MGILDNVAAPSAKQTEEEYLTSDSNNNKDWTVEGGVHVAKINLAFVSQSKKPGSKALALNLELDVDGKKVRAIGGLKCIYFTNQNQGVTYTKDDAEHQLPGYIKVNALAHLVADKEFADLKDEKITINQYDFKEKKEVPIEVDGLKELIGKEVRVGIIRCIEDINEEVPPGSGNWSASGRTRIENKVDTFFDLETEQTWFEKENNTDAEMVAKWKERFEGVTIDNSAAQKGHIEESDDTPTASAEGDDDLDWDDDE